MSKNNIKIALLLGGTSPERNVSKSSGKSILEAIRRLGYEVRVIDPAYGINQPDNDEAFFAEKDYTELSNRNYVEVINSTYFDDIDLAFIALHGKWGEDGTIQSLLELRGIKYTGSGVLASSLSMDKAMSKIMFQHFSVKTPKWFLIKNNDSDYGLMKSKISKFFGYPCVVKPNDEGSTIGLSICKNENEIEPAVKKAFEYSKSVIIEEYIPGREMTVGVLGQQVLPVLEIKPKHDLYDYECKYTHGMSEYEVPATISKETAKHLQSQALLAFNSLGCSSYARVDFRLAENGETFCLEVNSLPGMTSTSLVPKMAKAIGISFDELIDQIIKNAL